MGGNPAYLDRGEVRGSGRGVAVWPSRPGQVILRLAELIELWDVATALNDRIWRMVVQVLDWQTETPEESPRPAISLERPLAKEEFEGEDPWQIINGLIDKGLSPLCR